MDDIEAQRLFRRLDRAFWLIWLGFPVMVWLIAADLSSGLDALGPLPPEQLACLELMPQVGRFGAAGKAMFWSYFALEFLVFATLLALAHLIVHRCASGRIFVAQMIDALRAIGLIIAIWPVVDLALSNVVMYGLRRSGDLPAYVPDFALDLPVLGVGLLLITLAAAMRLAVTLSRDAELTI